MPKCKHHRRPIQVGMSMKTNVLKAFMTGTKKQINTKFLITFCGTQDKKMFEYSNVNITDG